MADKLENMQNGKKSGRGLRAIVAPILIATAIAALFLESREYLKRYPLPTQQEIINLPKYGEVIETIRGGEVDFALYNNGYTGQVERDSSEYRDISSQINK